MILSLVLEKLYDKVFQQKKRDNTSNNNTMYFRVYNISFIQEWNYYVIKLKIYVFNDTIDKENHSNQGVNINEKLFKGNDQNNIHMDIIYSL